jgi:thymidylate synthase
MLMIFHDKFPEVVTHLIRMFDHSGKWVHPHRWQGVDVQKRPEALMRELVNVTIGFYLQGNMNLDYWQSEVKPNLPWADDHFEERVSGAPLNPGTQWKHWPWANSADNFREAGQFNHTYMERFWPKYAGILTGELNTVEDFHSRLNNLDESNEGGIDELRGIRHSYGDLEDVVKLLIKDPFTRQAYLPIFFPEDTGVGDGGRKPCTLGYQFIRRENEMHLYYPMRSCDFVRHFRDDVYLAIRLVLWVLHQLHVRSPWAWRNVLPGQFIMHMTSLHMFVNDWHRLTQHHGEKV